MKRLYFTLCLFLTLCGSHLLRAQGDCVILEVSHALSGDATSVCVDVVARQFESVVGMQYSLRWDTDVLSFKAANNFRLPNLTNSNFGIPSVTNQPGKLNFLWLAENNAPYSLASDEVMYSLCFDIVGAPGDYARVDFDDNIVPEFIAGASPNFAEAGASLISGSVTVGNTATDPPVILPTMCPQANNCSEVPPAGIQTETSGGNLPYAYNWTGPGDYTATTEDLPEIVPGNYRVIVQDNLGLTGSILFHIPGETPLEIVNLSITQPETCNAPEGAVSFDISGGSGSYEYQWSDGASTGERSGLSPGLYELTVTDMLLGCSIYNSFTIFTSGDVSVKNAEITPVSCGTTATGAIRLELEGDTEGASISWSNGGTGTAIDGLPAGTYVATITDAANCATEWSGIVTTANEVVFSGEVDYVDCNENSGFINLNLPSDPAEYTYSWNTGETVKNVSGLSFGSYRVTVTHTASGCSGSRQFYIKDEDFITGSSWECTVVNEQTIFAKVSTIVWGGGTPPYTFNWSNGDSTTDDLVGSTTVSLPATLIVTITDAKGCVTIAEPITPDCSEGGTSAFSTASSYECVEDEQGALSQAKITYRVWDGGQPPYTFTWSNGLTEANVTESTIVAPADATLSYSVTVTDQLGLSHVSAPITPVCQIAGTPLVLDIGEASVEASGESVCLPIKVDNFNNMGGLQFSLSWDPTQLVADTIFSDVLPEFNFSNYNLGPFHGIDLSGYATLLWFDRTTQGITLPDQSILMEVCFTYIGDQPQTEVVVSNHPTIIEVYTADNQILPVITKPGVISLLSPAAKSVWPGDTDNNGLVDHFDLLNIGLAFGEQGYPRPDATFTWKAQFGTLWDISTPNTEVDYRHIDTDGNGTINVLDTLALALNYGLFNDSWNGEDGFTQRENLPEAARSASTPIYVDTYPVEEGAMPVFDIVLGDDENMDNTVYGLAFSIDYDPLAIVPGSIHISFDNSWIGQEEQDLLTFYRVDAQDHKIHVAMTRTDGVDITGSGPVAQLLITIEDVIFRSEEYDIPIAIENARIITSKEEAVPVAGRSSTITVSSTTSTLDAILDRQIKVYPVPARDAVYLLTPQLRMEQIELYDLEGRRLRQWRGIQDRLSLTGLPQGTYALRLITDKGVAVRRLVIMD